MFRDPLMISTETAAPFASAPPEVRLVKAFETPFQNAIATARTCYSGKGIVSDEQIDIAPEIAPGAADGRDAEIALSIYGAGHHTTLQHAHFQFALSNVSRQVLWSFFHAHPFYNSEQVSQRYVTVRPDAVAVPQLPEPALSIYRGLVARQMAAYERLTALLTPEATAQYFARFPARRKPAERDEAKARAVRREVKKKTQEVARYVLPVATHAHLYHTVSGLTLLRYWRACRQPDAPTETKAIVGAMIDELLRLDPRYRLVLESPLEPDRLPETSAATVDVTRARRFVDAFDRGLDGHTSVLVDWSARGEQTVASAVREVLGLSRDELSDGDAIARVLDPRQNRLLGESLRLGTHSKLMRALMHAHLTFRKKLSHTADSQDQRHRMTPGSRPVLAAHYTGAPDAVTPTLIRAAGGESAELYERTMVETWADLNRLLDADVEPEWALYGLPNAVAVRFTESGDFLALHHKHAMRLCLNAQEEIWRASLDEAMAVRQQMPHLGAWLLPPCTPRALGGTHPICPEGERFCGLPVWRLDLAQLDRVI